jgi:hypothetical protein
MRHWPEQLLALLLLCGTLAPFLAFPRSVGVLVPLGLVPVAWAVAFALWAGVVWVACWLYDRRSRGSA